MKLLVGDVASLGGCVQGKIIGVCPPVRRSILFSDEISFFRRFKKDTSSSGRRLLFNFPEMLFQIGFRKEKGIISGIENPDVFFLNRQDQLTLLKATLPNVNIFGDICMGMSLNDPENMAAPWCKTHKSQNFQEYFKTFLNDFWLSEFNSDRFDSLPVDKINLPGYMDDDLERKIKMQHIKDCIAYLNQWSENCKRDPNYYPEFTPSLIEFKELKKSRQEKEYSWTLMDDNHEVTGSFEELAIQL